MKIELKNHTDYNIWKIKPLFKSFLPYAQKYLDFDKPVCVNFLSDPDNARDALGKTGYYDPEGHEIGIYIDNRHPKDVLRSLAHELVHHAQNCAGMFKSDSQTSPGYAQKDPHLRRMERDAYERGNLCLRDWEDSIKIKLQETNYHNKYFKISEQLINNKYNNIYIINLNKNTKSGVKKNMKLSQTKLRSLIIEAFEEAGLKKGLNLGQKGGEDTTQTTDNNEVLEKIRYTIREALKNTPEALNMLRKGKLDESEGTFAPSHYCAHHVAEKVTGKKGVVIDHNWNKQLQEVTAYDVDFGKGDVRTLKVDKLFILEASLAEGHPGHAARDDDEEELAESPSHPADDRETGRLAGRRSKNVNTGERVEQNEGKKKPDGDGDGVPPWADKDDNDPKVQEEAVEEVNEEDDDDDTLEEVFSKRNKKIYENLANWAKK